MSPASPAAHRYDGDLACDARFFLKWDEDATSEPMDTLAGLLEMSKQLERTAMWAVTFSRRQISSVSSAERVFIVIAWTAA